ncbi:MAG: hypothetical protein VX920_01725 [Pseudomonadota bacterium]|nr:hypothetical protein [Pseudomonadota bacterium]
MRIIQVLVVSLLSFSVFAQDDNVFESVTVGFKVTKPSEWQFVTAEENLESLKNFQLNDDEFKQLMLKYSTAPLVAMMKYPEPFDDLNPSFKVNVKPLGNFKGDDPKKIMGLMPPQFYKMFDSFKLVQPPVDTAVDELPAAYMRMDYSVAISDGRSFPATSELWIVPRGDYFFLIGAGTRQDGVTGSREEISKIISSVEL